MDEVFAKKYRLKDVPFAVGWSIHGLSTEGTRRMLAYAGPVGLLWRLALRRRFDRGERQAFRYVTAMLPLW